MKDILHSNLGNIMYIYEALKKYSDVNHILSISEIIEYIKKDYNEEIEDASTAIKSLFKCNSNIINVLKNAKEILIDIVVGDKLEEKCKCEYLKEDFRYLEKYITINYDVIKGKDSNFVNKLKVIITITC